MFEDAESIDVTTKINSIYTYGIYEESNIKYRNTLLVKVDSYPIGCENGFYISEDDNLNNPSISAFLISAFHAGSSVRISAYTDQLLAWNGGQVCRVNSLALIK